MYIYACINTRTCSHPFCRCQDLISISQYSQPTLLLAVSAFGVKSDSPPTHIPHQALYPPPSSYGYGPRSPYRRPPPSQVYHLPDRNCTIEQDRSSSVQMCVPTLNTRCATEEADIKDISEKEKCIQVPMVTCTAEVREAKN